MSDEKELEKKKAAAAAKAKAEALKKKREKEAEDQASLGNKAEESQEKKGVSQEDTSKKGSEEDDDLAKKKAAAAAKAKAAALAKQKRKQEEASETEEQPSGDDELAKKKAAAAAKAKAAALARQKRKQAEQDSGDNVDDDDEKAKAAAKSKAAAAAKAKAAAAAKKKREGSPDADEPAGEDEKAKAVAAAKAKNKASGKKKDEPVEEEQPSPNQPVLDKYVKVIKEHLGEEVFEDTYINKLSKHVPTLVAKRDTYYKIAEFLKFNDQLGFDYLSELHGTDFETHMEVYVHLFSFRNKQSVALKVKIDRDQPELESVVGLWKGANWPECEAYDLFGIKFLNHPDLKRILLGEDWIGYPMRKDYQPHDVEV